MKAKSIKIVLLIWEFLKKLLSATNEVNMDTVIDLGSSKVKITTFDQKKKILVIPNFKIGTCFQTINIADFIKNIINFEVI